MRDDKDIQMIDEMTGEIYSCPLSSCSRGGHFNCTPARVHVYVFSKPTDITKQTPAINPILDKNSEVIRRNWI